MTVGVPPRALSIAGSDSGGGAGIQADLKTFTALGVYGITAITAVTVQNTQGVSDYQELTPGIVAAQIRSVASDIGVDAAKTGMLASARIVQAVAAAVRECLLPNLVVDPVFVSKHGHSLLDSEAVATLREELLPMARIVTPNLHEAARLAEAPPIESRDGMRAAAETIIGFGPRAVLMKGGHLEGPVAADLLFDGDEELWLESPRVDTPNTHGTGCVLSAAIAAHLARGAGLGKAVAEAKAFVTKAIERSLSIGQGIGPVNPVWELLGDEGEQRA